MARPPTYHSTDERPVSVSLRVPKAFYERAQQYASQRRLTLTELLLDGLQMRLETPTDPREVFLSDERNTVIQQLQEMVTATVQTELAKLLNMALPLPAHDIQPTNNDILYDNGNTVLQESSPQPAFDATKYRLGSLCPQGHDYHGTGQSLRRRTKGDCVACERLGTKQRRQRERKAQQAAR